MTEKQRDGASKSFRRAAGPGGEKASSSSRHEDREVSSMATDSEHLGKRLDDLRGHVDTRLDDQNNRFDDIKDLIVEQGKAQRDLIVEQGNVHRTLIVENGKLLRWIIGLLVGVVLGVAGIAVRVFLQ